MVATNRPPKLCAHTIAINMDLPCSKTPPTIAAAKADDPSSGNSEEEEDTDSKEGQKVDEEDNNSLGTDSEDEQSDPELELVMHRHHHRGGNSSSKHPWAGLCYSLGTFCGNGLFGYGFKASSVYTCTKIGAEPTFIKDCGSGCGSGSCIVSSITRTTGIGGPVVRTSTASTAVQTEGAKCAPLIAPIKDLIRQTIVSLERSLPLGPEASQLLMLALGTNLSSYFDNTIDSAGATAAIIAATIPQIVNVIKATQSSVSPVLNLADPAFQDLYAVLNQFAKASADLATCTGANVDCTGLVVLTGYFIKIGVPILRAYLAVKFPRKSTYH